MTKKLKYPSLLLGLLMLTGVAMPVSAQRAPSEYEKLYPREFLVGLQSRNHTTIEVSGDGLEIEEKVSSMRLYMDKRASEFGQMSVEYEPAFTEIDDLSAYTLVPEMDKDDYQKVKVKDIVDKKLISDEVFHDGTRAKVFTFPSVKKGAITVMEYTRRIHNPYLVGIEVFQRYSIQERQEFVIEHDESIEIDIRYVNCDESFFNYTEEHKGSKVIHTWVVQDVPKVQDEENMPALIRLAPHIVYRIKSYKDKSGDIPVLRDVNDLHRNYREYIRELAADDNADIARLTDSLTRDAETDLEKVDIIYKWVQNNVKYIAFEDGLGGFVPRQPSLVMNRRYGDCKDMSCLMVSMLRQAEIPAYYTWIGTRDIPYTYAEVPSSLSDNHMIATVELDGERIFLDATSQTLPFPMPSAFIQGKEALVDYGQDSFLVAQVPVVDASHNRELDSLRLRLEDGVLKGTGKRSYEGYFMSFLNSIESRKDGKLKQDRLEADVKKGSNKCSSKILELNNYFDHGNMTYEVEIPDYVYQDEDNIYINLNLENLLADMKLKPERKYPLEFDYAYTYIREYTLEIPEGYKVVYTPEDLHFDKEGLQADITYQSNGAEMVYQLKIVVNHLLITPELFEDFNGLIKALSGAYSNSISLKRI